MSMRARLSAVLLATGLCSSLALADVPRAASAPSEPVQRASIAVDHIAVDGPDKNDPAKDGPEGGGFSPVAAGLLDRPLFEPDRHAKTEMKPSHNELRLTGIVGSGTHWAAIFHDGPPEAHSVSRRVGQDIDTWTVASISSKEVLLRRDAQTTALAPSFLPTKPESVDASEKKGFDVASVPILKTKKTDPHLAW